MAGPSREAVRERLDEVYDPELDRSIADLEYVESIEIDGGRVAVDFVLPTAWCSPAFAWMMATGIRDEVGALPEVESVHVDLREHMHGEQINRGVNERLAFEEVFEDAEDGVEAVRRDLDRKARFARQYHAVEALVDAGLAPDQIVDLTPADLDRAEDRLVIALREDAVRVTVPAEPIDEYLEKAREVGVVAGPDDRLFATREGDPIPPDEFEAVRRDARLAKTTVTGQGDLCAQLHEARNGVAVELDD